MSPASDPVLLTPWVQSLVRLVERRMGYRLPDHRLIREIVPFTVAEAEARGLADPGVLVARVEAGGGRTFWEGLVDLATIGETYFFRHPEQCEALGAWLRARYRAVGRPLSIWSAGCSSGEEALTVAMILDEANVPYVLEASDLSEAALKRASAGGPYSDRSVGHLPARFRDRWLTSDGRGTWRLREERALPMEVRRHNLVTDPPLRPPIGAWDAILCRNVMIYLSKDAGRDAMRRLGEVLDVGGSLWIAPCDQVDLEEALLLWDRDGTAPHLRLRQPGEVAGGTRRVVPRPVAVPPPPRVSWTATLEALLSRGLFASAEEIVRQRSEAAPEDGAALVLRAAFLLRAHAFDEALTFLDRAVESHPRPACLHYLRGIALLGTGQREAALHAFLQSLKEDPDDWASGWQAAELYRRRGQRLLEEMMLKRTIALLVAEAPTAPAFGPAVRIVEGVHREPAATRRRITARLASLLQTSIEPGLGELS